ncbi:hypothetical protein ACFU8Q_35200 [Streptomyces sp. NPDC057543]
MTGAIRHALALNLRHHGQQFGADNLRWSDLDEDVITPGPSTSEGVG